MSFSGTVSMDLGAAGVVSGAVEAPLVGDVASGGAAAVRRVDGLFSSLRRKPSFSISKTERSCFSIKLMMALISLPSLGSKYCSWLRLRGFRYNSFGSQVKSIVAQASFPSAGRIRHAEARAVVERL